MPEFLKNISNQITEYLEKFSKKQKLQMGAIILLALVALGALAYYLSRPQFMLYADDVSPGEMNQMVETLVANNVPYKYEDGASKLYVEASKYQEVKMMFAKENILPTSGFKWKDAFNSNLTTTSGERDMMAQLAFENEIAEDLELLDAVSMAKVKFVLPNSENVVIKREQDASASIILELRDELSDEQIYGIALWVTDLVPNLKLENIKIMESKTNKLLFNGDPNTFSGKTTNLDITREYEKKYEKKLEALLFSLGGVDDAVVAVNLNMDFDERQLESTKHSLPDGQKSSLPTEVYVYESTGTSPAAGGIPGTDTNDGAITYVTDNGDGANTSVSINKTDFAVNTEVEKNFKAKGVVVPERSSVNVVLRKYKVYDEALLEESGALEETSWQQFKLDNDVDTVLEVSEDMVNFVRNSAQMENVAILSYEVAVFVDKVDEPIDFKTYIPIAIIIIMIILLGYSVYKNTASTEVTELEPELSVEEMLATTSTDEEDEEEEIDFAEKSHARVQVEKFIDENPEAVAQLLRNWLNEDWD